MNIYDLSRSFWDFTFENAEKIKPNHVAMYFFAIEHCNRLGWKKTFGFPTSMVMDAIGIKSYNTYSKTLQDLVDFGFIKMIEKSKNQYSSNIIALSKNNKAQYKALDKAIIAHSFCSIKKEQSTIQSNSESTVQSIDSINKPIYQSTNIPIYNVEELSENQKISEFKSFLKTEKQIQMDRLKMAHKLSDADLDEKINEFVEKKVSWGEDGKWKDRNDMAKNFEFWLSKNPKIEKQSYLNWDKKHFFEEISQVAPTLSKQIKQEFFDHYAQPTPNGTMLLQTFPAWDTKTRIRKWIESKKSKNYAN